MGSCDHMDIKENLNGLKITMTCGVCGIEESLNTTKVKSIFPDGLLISVGGVWPFYLDSIEGDRKKTERFFRCPECYSIKKSIESHLKKNYEDWRRDSRWLVSNKELKKIIYANKVKNDSY